MSDDLVPYGVKVPDEVKTAEELKIEQEARDKVSEHMRKSIDELERKTWTVRRYFW